MQKQNNMHSLALFMITYGSDLRPNRIGVERKKKAAGQQPHVFVGPAATF